MRTTIKCQRGESALGYVFLALGVALVVSIFSFVKEYIEETVDERSRPRPQGVQTHSGIVRKPGGYVLRY